MQLTCKREGLAEFLINHFGSDIKSFEPIVGDAGFRDYYRIESQKKSYIIMDCPPSYCSIEPFIFMAKYLKEQGFKAPDIINYDINLGFIILEDFGSLSMKSYLQQFPDKAKKQYYLMVDLLVELSYAKPPAELKHYDAPLMLEELELFTTWYIPHIQGRILSREELMEFKLVWQETLQKIPPLKQVVMMRDYHVENIMWLGEGALGLLDGARRDVIPAKAGIHEAWIPHQVRDDVEGMRDDVEGGNNISQYHTSALGLLDFQDALIGNLSYDLVSLLEDARIEVPRSLALECIQYFAKKVGVDETELLLQYHILGSQRNSRILGVFARKFLRDGNSNYLQYMPLVLKYLAYDLSHPELASLKKYFEKLKIL